MKMSYAAVLVGGALVGGSVFAQSASSVAGQSIWRHEGPTSVTGQSIWRHEGLPGTAPGSARLSNRRAASHGHIRPDREFIGLGIGSTGDFGCSGNDADAAAYQAAQDFFQPGYQWGAGLRANTLAWGDLVPYLEQYILNADPRSRDAFRRGFVKAFGGNGEATYDSAYRQAARPG